MTNDNMGLDEILSMPWLEVWPPPSLLLYPPSTYISSIGLCVMPAIRGYVWPPLQTAETEGGEEVTREIWGSKDVSRG